MKPLVLALTLVIVGLIAASYLFVTGLSQETRVLASSLAQLREVASSDDEPLSPDTTKRLFIVEKGDTAAVIGERLEKAGLIRSSLSFRYRARNEGVDSHFEAGEYQLSPSMRISEIMEALHRGRISVENLTIPEGWRIAQIADAIDARRPGVREEFLRTVTNPTFNSPLISDRPAGTTLEGYLFPDTYQFDRETSVARIAETMTTTLSQRVSPEVIASARARGLTFHQLLTLASIVEREAQFPAERVTIAGVFLNRIKQGMPLQADATVQYAIRPTNSPSPDGTYWKRELTAADLRQSSLFNTYINKGLPPSPISSPGLASIQAAATAPPTDMLYFVARPDGSHAFSRTLQEHNANVARYLGSSR